MCLPIASSYYNPDGFGGMSGDGIDKDYGAYNAAYMSGDANVGVSLQCTYIIGI